MVDKTESLARLPEEFGLYSVGGEGGVIGPLPPPLVSIKEVLVETKLVSLVSQI